MELKSRIFRNYNMAKGLGIERARLNKALGLAQSNAEPRYITTLSDCTCGDRKYRGGWCKHIVALNLRAVA